MKLETLHKDWKGTCVYCGVKAELTTKVKNARLQATRDHFIPLNAGGGKGKNNIVLSCRDCNEHKDCRDPRIYLDVWHAVDRKSMMAYVAKLEAAHQPASGLSGRLRALLPGRRRPTVRH